MIPASSSSDKARFNDQSERQLNSLVVCHFRPPIKVMNQKSKTMRLGTFLLVFLLTVSPAYAYVGPGAGLGAIASILAVGSRTPASGCWFHLLSSQTQASGAQGGQK